MVIGLNSKWQLFYSDGSKDNDRVALVLFHTDGSKNGDSVTLVAVSY